MKRGTNKAMRRWRRKPEIAEEGDGEAGKEKRLSGSVADVSTEGAAPRGVGGEGSERGFADGPPPPASPAASSSRRRAAEKGSRVLRRGRRRRGGGGGGGFLLLIVLRRWRVGMVLQRHRRLRRQGGEKGSRLAFVPIKLGGGRTERNTSEARCF